MVAIKKNIPNEQSIEQVVIKKLLKKLSLVKNKRIISIIKNEKV
jgi:hypothetical protein